MITQVHLTNLDIDEILQWGKKKFFFATPWTVHGIIWARILEWAAFPFSRGSSQPRDQTQVSHIAGGCFLPAEPQGKPLDIDKILQWGKKEHTKNSRVTFQHYTNHVFGTQTFFYV